MPLPIGTKLVWYGLQFSWHGNLANIPPLDMSIKESLVSANVKPVGGDNPPFDASVVPIMDMDNPLINVSISPGVSNSYTKE